MSSTTIITYGFGIGAICTLGAKLWSSGFAFPTVSQTTIIAVAPGITATVIPVALYTLGLRRLRPSSASVVATLEPVVAILLAAAILDQRLGFTQGVGAVMIVAAAIYLSVQPRSRAAPKKMPAV